MEFGNECMDFFKVNVCLCESYIVFLIDIFCIVCVNQFSDFHKKYPGDVEV